MTSRFKPRSTPNVKMDFKSRVKNSDEVLFWTFELWSFMGRNLAVRFSNQNRYYLQIHFYVFYFLNLREKLLKKSSIRSHSTRAPPWVLNFWRVRWSNIFFHFCTKFDKKKLEILSLKVFSGGFFVSFHFSTQNRRPVLAFVRKSEGEIEFSGEMRHRRSMAQNFCRRSRWSRPGHFSPLCAQSLV